MTDTTCSGCAAHAPVATSSSTASRGTWTASPRRPRAATVSEDGRPNWTVTAAARRGPDPRPPRRRASKRRASASVMASPRVGSSIWRRKSGLVACWSRTKAHSSRPMAAASSVGSCPLPSLLSLTMLYGPRMAQVVSGAAERGAPWQRGEAAGRAADLGHDEVVVRVEPLRHLPRLAILRSSGQHGQHAERVVGDRPAEIRGNEAELHHGLEHSS